MTRKPKLYRIITPQNLSNKLISGAMFLRKHSPTILHGSLSK